MVSSSFRVVSLCSLLALAASLQGCGSGGGGGSQPPPASGGNPPADSSPQAAEAVQVSVKSFDSADPCSDLKSYLVDYADTQMRRQLTAARDAQTDYAPGTPFPFVTTASGAEASTAAPAPSNASASAGAGDSASRAGANNFTTTNIQTVGIDELDRAKNNARHLFRLYADGDRTYLSKTRYWPATDLAAIGKTEVPIHQQPAPGAQRAWVQGMFVTDSEQAVVLSTLDAGYYWPTAGDARTAGTAVASSASLPFCSTPGICGGGPQFQRSYVDLFDAAVNAAPVFQATIAIGGRLLDSRRRGQQLWVLTQESFKFPTDVLLWPKDFDYAAPLAQRRAAFDRQIEQNAGSLRLASLKDWLPDDLATAVSGGNASAAAQACRSVKKVSEPTELAWLRIASVNLSDRSVSSELILAEGQSVYASDKAIYVTTHNWRSVALADPGPRTYIHKFSISDGGLAQYAASGAFAGQPLNSYSFDEDAQGTLRFAANAVRNQSASGTVTPSIDPTRPVPEVVSWEPYSYLGLIRQQGARLVVTARSAPIAPGERMQSARYIGGRGYLVTFRQVDPFFVFDMNAEGGPKQLGELKIPGFSTYLHPIDANHLVGIGFADGGWPRRIKASLFDVTDPANPKEQSQVILADVYSGSDALWDPHAFNYLAQSASSGVLAVPVWSYAYFPATGPSLTQRSSLKLINVSAAQGLSLAGEIGVDDLLAPVSNGYYYQDRYVRRSILADGFAFAVGERVLRSASLDRPDQTVSSLITP